MGRHKIVIDGLKYVWLDLLTIPQERSPPSMIQIQRKEIARQALIFKQAHKAIEIIKDFAKEKFPIFGGAIDKLFTKYSNTKPDDDFMP